MLKSQSALSPKRASLCSRDHALRVAERLFDTQGRKVSIIRTNDPLQPFRVSTTPRFNDHVEVEMVA